MAVFVAVVAVWVLLVPALVLASTFGFQALASRRRPRPAPLLHFPASDGARAPAFCERRERTTLRLSRTPGPGRASRQSDPA
jgi:hypothetical protein